MTLDGLMSTGIISRVHKKVGFTDCESQLGKNSMDGKINWKIISLLTQLRLSIQRRFLNHFFQMEIQHFIQGVTQPIVVLQHELQSWLVFTLFVMD